MASSHRLLLHRHIRHSLSRHSTPIPAVRIVQDDEKRQGPGGPLIETVNRSQLGK